MAIYLWKILELLYVIMAGLLSYQVYFRFHLVLDQWTNVCTSLLRVLYCALYFKGYKKTKSRKKEPSRNDVDIIFGVLCL